MPEASPHLPESIALVAGQRNLSNTDAEIVVTYAIGINCRMFADANLIARDGRPSSPGFGARRARPMAGAASSALRRAIASTVTLPHPQWWCRHGFLVVVQDVRGQGDSQGPSLASETNDTAGTLNWLRELSEVNGRLATWLLLSRPTQLLAPEECPPPDCMAPAMCGLDERNHWSCEEKRTGGIWDWDGAAAGSPAGATPYEQSPGRRSAAAWRTAATSEMAYAS